MNTHITVQSIFVFWVISPVGNVRFILLWRGQMSYQFCVTGCLSYKYPLDVHPCFWWYNHLKISKMCEVTYFVVEGHINEQQRAAIETDWKAWTTPMCDLHKQYSFGHLKWQMRSWVITDLTVKYLPGNWNWILGEAGAGDGEVTVPEEVMRRAGEEGVEESHDDVLEPESCSSWPWKLGMELFGLSVSSSPWWPAAKILGLVLRRSGIGDSEKVNHNFRIIITSLVKHWCNF